MPVFFSATASTFPAATATTAFGVHSTACMINVGPLLPVSRKKVMPLSNNLGDLIAADAVTRCQVPCLHLVCGRQSVNEEGLEHVVVKCQACCTHRRGKILDRSHPPERLALRLYLGTVKASREVGFGPCRLRATPGKESVPRFPRRSTPVLYTLITLALESR